MLRVVVLTLLSLLCASCGRIGFDSISRCAGGGDCDGLRLTTTVINQDEDFATGPRLSIALTVSGGIAPLEVRVAAAASNGDCQSQYDDNAWHPYAPNQALPFIVAPHDGEKKLCAWARDSVGNLTVIAPSSGTHGVDSDGIVFSRDNIPVVESFQVSNASTGLETHQVGDRLRIAWIVRDREALAENPIDLYYSIEEPGQGSWQEVARDIAGTADGTTRNSGTYELFEAPTTEPFRLRLIVRDAAGNESLSALSSLQNGGLWSVFMGSRDPVARGAAEGTSLQHGINIQGHFAIDERTGDAYAVDFNNGVVRMDGATGVVEQFLGDGPLNLPDDDFLPTGATIPEVASLTMGNDGLLYIGVGLTTSTESNFIYQYDPATNRIRLYIGGGTISDETATSDTIFALAWHFTFDEDNSLYFITRCTGDSGAPIRLMKVTQNPDGTPDTFSVVAGDCSDATPPDSASDPLAIPFGVQAPRIFNITVWDRGTRIYYGGYNTGTWKIIDGLHYRSDINVGGSEALAYDRSTNTLVAADQKIVRYQLDLEGVGGETLLETVVANTGLGDCARDGVLAEDACVHTQYSIKVGSNGTLFFADGASLNEQRSYRVRYVDSEGRVQTYLGALAFAGDGASKENARGLIGGIHYKAQLDPNQGAFAAGLYFVSPAAQVFGFADEVSEYVSILWGNQSGTAVEHFTGEEIGTDVGLGIAYAGGNMEALAFDSDGLPWFRYGPAKNRSNLIRVDRDRKVVALQNGYQDWELAANGSDPANLDLWPYGTQRNLALKGHAAFMTGSFASTSSTVVIKALDFANGIVNSVIGAAPNGVSPDLPTPGSVSTATLDESCFFNRGDCWVYYSVDEDRLYFTEQGQVRFITNPADSNQSTLGTLWDSGQSSIRNFTLSPDRTMLFYLRGERLYCHNNGGAPSFCNDEVLGPPAILGSIRLGPNQLTWKNSSTLLISSYRGEVFSFDASP